MRSAAKSFAYGRFEPLRSACSEVSLGDNIDRLEVAVDDAFLVGRLQAGGHLATQPHRALGGEAAPEGLKLLAQGAAVQVLHDQECRAFRSLPILVDLHQARVLHHAGGARLV